MLGATAIPGTTLRPQHEWHRQLATRHEMRLRGTVDELVECEGDEVDEHDLEHRPQPGLRRPDRDTGDRSFADRRVDHALGAELLGEAGCRGVRPTLCDVLADHEHLLVRAHRARQGRRDRVDVGRLSHAA